MRVYIFTNNCVHIFKFSVVFPGDHLQLRPSNCVYELSKKYNLDLSLFERLLNNGIGARCLGIQHRMRPEIARLTKHFYASAQSRQQIGLLPDGIRDHERVTLYEHIKGVSSSLFFLDHKWPEKSDDESRSHSNLFEAQMAGALCKYLTLQGTFTQTMNDLRMIRILITSRAYRHLLLRVIAHELYNNIN